MKTISVILLSLFLSSFAVGNNSKELVQTNKEEVFICTGKGAKCYHNNRKCWGLNKCGENAEIVKLSLDKAKKEYRACKICYKVKK